MWWLTDSRYTSPVKGLNLFSRSNVCLPRVVRSTRSPGQMANSSMVLLIWKILLVTASLAGPRRRRKTLVLYWYSQVVYFRTKQSVYWYYHGNGQCFFIFVKLLWGARTLFQIYAPSLKLHPWVQCDVSEWGPTVSLNFSPDTILHLADAPAFILLSSYHTSVCSVEPNAKVSIGSTRVMAGSEDDAANGFVFPDHAGDGRCGHYPVVSNDQTAHLGKSRTGVRVCVSRLEWAWILKYLSGGRVGNCCHASSLK